MRALFYSLFDVDPIGKDGWLFSCQFNVSSTTTATRCPITLSNLIVSDSKGGRLPATAANGVITVVQPGAQTAGAAAQPPVQTSAGCAIQATTLHSCSLLWLLMVPMVLANRRRRSS
jgi:hypothetical protein